MHALTPPQIPIRKLNIDLTNGFDRHWHSGDAFHTAFYNALSMSFPAGEQRFIDSVQACLKFLPAEPRYDALRAQIRDFSGQEATHRHIHSQYNQQLIEQGLVNHWEARIHERFAAAADINPRHHLAITSAFEHYTAVLSQIMLERPAMMANAQPKMQQLWMWHAMEETEHKSVAFDLYQAISASYPWRRRWFLYATLSFLSDTFRQTVNNLWHDGSLFKPSTWWSAFKFFFGRPGSIDKATGHGLVWLIFSPLKRYLREDFHPWQEDNRARAEAYAQANQAQWRVIR